MVNRGTRHLTLAAAALAAVATLAVSVFHLVPFSHTSRDLRVTLETAQALVGFLVTHLLYGRFKRTGLRCDLVLVYGMGLIAATNLLFILGPILGARFETSSFQSWASLGTRFVAAVALVGAAWMPRTPASAGDAGRLVLGSHALSLVVIVGVVAVLENDLPLGVETSGREGDPNLPGLESHPVLASTQIVLMALFWAAAAGFVRRADQDPSPLTTALAVGLVLTGSSRLNFFLYPSLYTDVIYVGDLLRLAGYVALLGGAGQEIRSYWQGLAQVAVTEERRRTARELHDGLVQELAFIRSHAPSLSSDRVEERLVEQISSAADRALTESRQAIEALSGADDDDVELVLRRAAQDVVGRAGGRVRVDVAAGVELRPEITEALSRIVREACTNAVRHGKARDVGVCLEAGEGVGVRLTVSDDGDGFAPDDALRPHGFGLTSMRQRAERAGGRLRVDSALGRGTTVEVVIPTDARRRGRGR